MNADGDEIDRLVRRAMGGDDRAIRWLQANADGSGDPIVLVVAGVLDQRPDRVEAAARSAVSSRGRQVAAIAAAHLRGEDDLVDGLARDHLVDHPDSVVVAWIVSRSNPT